MLSPQQLMKVDNPRKLETYKAYLKRMEIEYFNDREVTRLRRADRLNERLGKQVFLRYQEPPRSWWPRIVPTLRLADIIRCHLTVPGYIGNGFRPTDYNRAVGGSRFSSHRKNRAIDYDISSKDRHLQEELYRFTCELWLHYDELPIGIGLYRPWRGTRVHIDVGHRPWPGFRARRYWKKQYVRPILEGLR